MLRFNLVLSLIGIALFETPILSQADSGIYTASFIATWAGDTASIETFTIAGNHLIGKAIHLYPEPHLKHFSVLYNDDGSIRNMDFQFFQLDNTSLLFESKTNLPYRVHMSMNDGVLNSHTCYPKGAFQFIHKTPRADFNGGWIPILGQWEWMTSRWAHGNLDDGLVFVNYALGPYDLTLEARDDHTLVFTSGITAPITFFLDEHRRIEHIDAMGSPWNYLIEKSSPVDLDLYVDRFSRKPTVGYPSPRQHTAKEVAGIKCAVEYGSPRKRGRQIFGNVVPYDVVWRTVAGSATTMSFDHDVRFDQTIIPQGTYNIFTVPGKDGWKLIFNTEESAWGSAYRSEFDFAAVPMETYQADHTFEEFTIELTEKLDRGLLRFIWDDTVAEIDFEKD